jgi:hypothetical protein
VHAAAAGAAGLRDDRQPRRSRPSPASWQGGPFTFEMTGEVLLPGPDARIGTETFDDWLAPEASSD